MSLYETLKFGKRITFMYSVKCNVILQPYKHLCSMGTNQYLKQRKEF